MPSVPIRFVITITILISIFLAQYSPTFASSLMEPAYDAVHGPDDAALYQQNISLRIGVLFPQDGIASAYGASLQTAIDTIREQLKANPSLPRIEFIEAKLLNSESRNAAAIGRLISRDVDAIIAPNFLSALITASPEKLDVLPLVSRADKTHELAWTGESSLYSDLTQHSVIIRTIQKLKFRSRLEQVVVMYDPTDAFGRSGYDVIVEVLSNEKASFSTEIFSAGNIDFLAKLSTLKEETPQATVIIVGKTADVADVIIQAQDEVGLTGNVLGFIGDGNPAVYDLADQASNREISGVAWDVVPQQNFANLVVAHFDNDRFAAEAYIAIWTILNGVGDEHPPSRAGIRNAFIEHEGHNLEEPSASLVSWFYQLTRNSINQGIKGLGSLQSNAIGRNVPAPVTTDQE